MMWTFDTGGGPVIEFREADEHAARIHVEHQIPLLRRRGYTHTWTEGRNGWTLLSVFNSRGRLVHTAALHPGRLHALGLAS